MLKCISYPALVLTTLLTMGHTKLSSSGKYSNTIQSFSTASFSNPFTNAYCTWQLDKSGMPETAFNYAIKGFIYLKEMKALTNENILTIIDYSKPSWQKRLFIIDVVNGKLLYNTLVAHGKNSGSEYANTFSNLPESHQSSLGFYVTGSTYCGSNGYSLKLKGCEKGFNDKAMERAIVVHGASYVSTSFIGSPGFVGRSYGCPSLPVAVSKAIIDEIKNGSCMFVYYPSKNYITHSKILNNWQ